MITIVSAPRWVAGFQVELVWPWGAGGLLAVEIDGERGPVEPGTGHGLGEWSASTGVINVIPKSASDPPISSAEG
ncbi:hypothetical protein ACWDKQ_33495 [Saccharopolyspora sp. NPDC000995]